MILAGWLLFTAALSILAWWCGKQYGYEDGINVERRRWLMGMARASTLKPRSGSYWLTDKATAWLEAEAAVGPVMDVQELRVEGLTDDEAAGFRAALERAQEQEKK